MSVEKWLRDAAAAFGVREPPASCANLMAAFRPRGGGALPWLPEDAYRHTHKADTPHLCRLWAEVANSVLAETCNEAYAVRAANAAVRRAAETDPSSLKESKEDD
jgi:hypothetical protein